MSKLTTILPFAFFLLIGANCKITKNVNYEERLKEAEVYDYKLTYFRKLLLEGFNHSDAVKNLLSNDASKGIADPALSTYDNEFLDSCVKVDNLVIIKDSVRRDSLFKQGKIAEGNQGKYVFSYALERFNSKWLDSLAKARYSVYKKLEAE